jgi:hypothetical protein
MQANNKRRNVKRTNTRKVKRGGDKKTFDNYVQTIIKNSKIDVTVQNAMLEIALTDKSVIKAYMLDEDVIKKVIIPTLIGKLDTISKDGEDHAYRSSAELALRQIKVASESGDSPVFEVRSPFHPHTPQTRKKRVSSSSS